MVTHRQPQGGPPLAILAGISGGLVAAGVVVGMALAGGLTPSPFASSSTIVDFFRDHRDAVQAIAFLHFASAVPLVIYAATVNARLRNLGVRAPGATIAFAGGLVAAVMWSLSACLGWVLARPEVAATPSLVRALHDAAFITGGPGHIVGLGLLVAGVAVPSLFVGLLPRWLCWCGLAIAVVSELSSVVLVVAGAAFLLAVARGTGFVWLIAAGALLPTSRTERPERVGRVPAQLPGTGG